MASISKIEKRLSNLENKTAELPEKDGIKQLTDELKENFSEFLADFLSKQNKQEPEGGGPYR